MAESSDVPGYAPRELTIHRVFSAPRSLVYRMWTEPDHMAAWFGPRMFTNPRCELDVRPGGAIFVEMQGPDGTIYPMGGQFIEVRPPEQLVFTSAALDHDGTKHLEVHNTITLTEENGRTLMKLVARVLSATEIGEGYLSGMEEGWKQSFDKLDDHLKTL